MVLTHECIHCLRSGYERDSQTMGDAFDEGCAEYFTLKLMEAQMRSEGWKSYYEYEVNTVKWLANVFGEKTIASSSASQIALLIEERMGKDYGTKLMEMLENELALSFQSELTIDMANSREETREAAETILKELENLSSKK